MNFAIEELKLRYPTIEFIVEQPLWFAAQKKDAAEFPSSRVYFIAAARRAIKIGVSDTPEERLRELQTAHFESLVLLGTMPGHRDTEWYLHKDFATEHLRGEWFRPSRRLLSFIKDNRLQNHIRV
jgi:hypothetical protein